MIPEQAYKEAKLIVQLYELQIAHQEYKKIIPSIEAGMVLEYRDLTGRWYEFTKDMQDNIHFKPEKIRVKLKKHGIK